VAMIIIVLQKKNTKLYLFNCVVPVRKKKETLEKHVSHFFFGSQFSTKTWQQKKNKYIKIKQKKINPHPPAMDSRRMMMMMNMNRVAPSGPVNNLLPGPYQTSAIPNRNGTTVPYVS
jgi:hypothetical protein